MINKMNENSAYLNNASLPKQEKATSHDSDLQYLLDLSNTCTCSIQFGASLHGFPLLAYYLTLAQNSIRVQPYNILFQLF